MTYGIFILSGDTWQMIMTTTCRDEADQERIYWRSLLNRPTKFEVI